MKKTENNNIKANIIKGFASESKGFASKIRALPPKVRTSPPKVRALPLKVRALLPIEIRRKIRKKSTSAQLRTKQKCTIAHKAH